MCRLYDYDCNSKLKLVYYNIKIERYEKLKTIRWKDISMRYLAPIFRKLGFEVHITWPKAQVWEICKFVLK